MHSILVIDDEYPIREWLLRTIRMHYSDWRVDSAVNGLDALQKLEEFDYQLIISDIRMQKLDGIGLLEQMQRSHPHVGIIVLSSYDDYQYVRSAFMFHATDYLLKSEISEEYLINAIRSFFSSYRKAGEKDLLPQLLKDAVIHKKIEPKAFWDKLQQQPESIPQQEYFCFLTKSDLYDSNDTKQYIPVENSIRLRFFVRVSVSLSIGCAELGCEPSRLLQIQSQFVFCNELQQRNRLGLVVATTIASKPGSLLPLLNSLFEHRNIDFYERKMFILGHHPGKENLDVNSLYFHLQQATAGMDTAGILQELNSFLAALEQHIYPNIDFVRNAVVNICEAAGRQQGHKGPSDIDIARLTNQVQGCGRLAELKETAGHFLHSRLGAAETVQAGISLRTQKTLAFLRDNYMKPVTLVMAADYVQVNPEYLSRLFKKDMNLNFNTYLCNLRLEKALELIRNTDTKIQDIAFSVGFQNLAYFSKCFKSQYGASPLEFRSIQKRKEV